MENDVKKKIDSELALHFVTPRQKELLTINNEDIDVEDLYRQPYVPIDDIENIKNADVLLLPIDHYKGMVDRPLFPEDTPLFYQYLKKNKDIKSEICVSDDKFETLGLHFDVMVFATMLVKEYVLPVLLGVISSFLHDFIKSRNKKKDEVEARKKIIVKTDEKNKTKLVSFEDTAEQFEKAAETIKKNFEE